jgi:hypothetical protein
MIHTCVKQILQLVNVWHRPRQAVDTLDVETKQVHGLDTLVHHHRHS